MSEYHGKGKRRLKVKDVYHLLERYRKPYGVRRGGGGSYRPRSNPYVMRHNFRCVPEPRDKPPKVQYSWGKAEPWTEREQYRPRERLVYDPEVKRLLESIDKHLEENLEKSETEDPEVSQQSEPIKVDSETELNDSEVGSDKQPNTTEADAMRDSLHESESIQDTVESSETPQDSELNTDVTETLENQDLSELEAELLETELHPEPLEETEPHTYDDYLELEADSLEDLLADVEPEEEPVEEAEG